MANEFLSRKNQPRKLIEKSFPPRRNFSRRNIEEVNFSFISSGCTVEATFVAFPFVLYSCPR